ncbi:hypothetical protein [Rheinheimera oceanensis]|uniref:hypothetical protein n=1 Tax=Rheinheimera oceanensis TaxID=2817449 RepID=UPI001BFD84A8|nr:hypothetical protein [Rheinheimera oceanensis]
MSFVIVWDTCLEPEYYADLHNVLASPAGTVLRYDYSRKYFDPESLKLFDKLRNKKIDHIEVLLCYGEQSQFDKAKSRIKEDIAVIVPFRLGKVKSAKQIENNEDPTKSKLIYDIEILGYPDLQSYRFYEKKFRTIIGDRKPLKFWHTYIEENSLIEKLLNEATRDEDNWSLIVEELKKLQFCGDSFWRIDFYYDFLKTKKVKFLSNQDRNSSTVSFLETYDEAKIFLDIHYISSHDSQVQNRELLIESSENIIPNKKRIKLRPYSQTSFQVKALTKNHIYNEFGSLEIETKDDSKNTSVYATGAHLRFDILTKIHWPKKIAGIFFGILSVPIILVSSKYPIMKKTAEHVEEFDCNTAFWVFIALIIGTLMFVVSGVILRKEFSIK